MQLCESFIKELGNESNRIAVIRGLNFCVKELRNRIGSLDAEDVAMRFFDDGKFSYNPNLLFHEVMDFWSVYLPYDAYLNQRQRVLFASFLELIYDLDGYYQIHLVEKLAASKGKDFYGNLEGLCDHIEEIYNSKEIKLLKGTENEIIYELPMDQFERRLDSFYYYAIKYKLGKWMAEGGTAVVVAGSDGLTPKRLHGYTLGEDDWVVCDGEKLLAMRESLLQSCPEAGVRGALRGYYFP